MDREFETIEVAEAKPGVVVVTLNRPDKGNGVVPELACDLRGASTAAVSIAERIAANPWRAVEAAKQALRASWHQDLAGALNFGYWTAGALHYTDDFQGRVAAFVNREAPS